MQGRPPSPLGERVETLARLNGGLNDYTSPADLPPQFWASASNVFSGQHGEVRRARFGSIWNSGTSGYATQGTRFSSLYVFGDPTPQQVLLGDNNNKLWAFNLSYPSGTKVTQRLNLYVDPSGTGDSKLAGPWSRASQTNMVFEVNGQVKQKGRGTLLGTIEGWGIDTPDASPSVTLSSGAITKSVGRSYAFAWENNNTAHVSAPSPATQYVAYSSQQGAVACVQPGTVGWTGSTNVITGTGTAFSQAWVGRGIWVENHAFNAQFCRIISVQSATQLTISGTWASGDSNERFQIIDFQTTHIRLYATGDGGSIYYLLGRNSLNFASGDFSINGISFVDNSNADPPSSPFTNEITQPYNIPPPIGAFLQEFQSRIVVYGIPGAEQTFFYTNIESTQVGQSAESCAPLNQATLPIGSARLRGAAPLPTGLLLWSDKRDMFKISGELTDNTLLTGIQLGATIQQLPYPIGCASPYAAIVTFLGAIWLSSDLEVWLFTDRYAPRNIGRSVQTTLSTINRARLQYAKAAVYKKEDRNWFTLAISTGSSTYNNKLLVLDLDLLAANGQPSFFTFDMATNSPSWYVFDISCEAVVGGVDSDSLRRLFGSDVDAVRDLDYNGSAFLASTEDAVSGNVTQHAVGNDSPEVISRLDFLRFVTNDAPDNIVSNGWSFGVKVIDDDRYTFGNPQSVTLTPGTDSPSTSQALEYGPTVFRFGGVKYAIGRRFQLSTTFPTAAGDWRLRQVQVQRRGLVIR